MAETTEKPAAENAPDLRALHAYWKAEIERYEKDAEKWVTRSKKVIKLYKDADNDGGRRKRYNILWSNVETLKPALYARDPKPEIERRFKDSDPLGRAASEVLERCVSYTIAMHGFTDVMRQVVQDRLLPGRGTAWVRYLPTLGEKEAPTEPAIQPTDIPPPSDQTATPQQPVLSVLYEQALVDYVYWEDFGHSFGRVWEEVPCVWRRSYLTRKELVDEFGPIGESIPLDWQPKGLKDENVDDAFKKAVIYEGWDKAAGAIWFLSKEHPEVIKYVPDPIGLTGVFPCPKPLFGTLTNDSLIPTPDYALYQTQAQELEELTARIGILTKALRIAGVYDSSAPSLSNLLSGDAENKLIPVERWAVFAERGGLKASIDFLPIKEVAEVLIALYEARDKVKADLYEITGLADIIRGNSDPGETATAQQMKGRFAVLRISDTQAEVQRFARDLIRLMSEIIAEHFSLETIKEISGVKLLMTLEKQALIAKLQVPGAQPPDEDTQELLAQPTWEEVHAILKNDVLRKFHIDVESDSTVRTDEDSEREDRTAFLQAAGGYLQQATAAGAQSPEMIPLLSELLMFGIRSFRSARTLEPAFEAAQRRLDRRAQQPPPPPPEVVKAQAAAQMKQQELAAHERIETTKANLNIQVENAKQNAQAAQAQQQQSLEAQKAQLEMQNQMQLEQYKANLTAQTELTKLQLQHEHELRLQAMKSDSDERIAKINADAKRESDQLRAMTATSIADAKNEAAEGDGE